MCVEWLNDNQGIASILEAVATVITAGLAYFAIKQTNKQLKIEQTPFVCVSDSFTKDEAVKKKIGSSSKLLPGLLDYSKEENLKVIREQGIRNFYTLRLKNIGRGAAYKVRVSYDKNEIKALFRSDQPHSRDIAANEKVSWIFEKENPDRVQPYKEKRGSGFDYYIDVFIFFEDLSGKKYKVKTKMRLKDGLYKVMENKLVK